MPSFYLNCTHSNTFNKGSPIQKDRLSSFAYTILYVDDLVKSLNFYEKVFDCKRKLLTPDNSYGEVAKGETTLSFATHTLAQSNFSEGFVESKITQQPFGIEIGFTTQEVAGTLKKAVDAGAVIYAEPKTKPWGQVVAYVRDINGFLVEICTPMN